METFVCTVQFLLRFSLQSKRAPHASLPLRFSRYGPFNTWTSNTLVTNFIPFVQPVSRFRFPTVGRSAPHLSLQPSHAVSFPRRLKISIHFTWVHPFMVLRIFVRFPEAPSLIPCDVNYIPSCKAWRSFHLLFKRNRFCNTELDDWLKKHSRHFLTQSEVKPKPVVTGLYTFSRPLRQPHVFTSSFDWFIELSVRNWLEWLLWFWLWQ